MLGFYKLKRLNWELVRAHLCTLAISVSLSATWRAPRDAFRLGGLALGVALTAALLAVALPVTLLQLAVGQLSQQDPVGVWKAVPFFGGVGYLRMIITVVSSAYCSIYVSVSIAYFLYTASNSIPFVDCVESNESETDFENPFNASECLSATFMSPVDESPEYYIAIALVVIALWIACPFVYYNSVKLMKRIFYALGPSVLVLGVVTMSCLGERSSLSTIVYRHDWNHYLEPNIWFSSIVQALWSCQISGGYLISAGDSVYCNTNVQWTALAIVGANVLSSWFWLVFWFATSGTGHEDTSVFAVLVQTYQVAVERNLSKAWPLLMFATLILSGIISLLALLCPMYDRLRRVGGIKWRLATFGCSVGGAGASLAVLRGGLPALALLEDTAVPVLVCVATVLEILAFCCIYGWNTLIEDVEFLIGSELARWWAWGWWAAPGVISASTAWWVADMFLRGSGGSEPEEAPWEQAAVLSAAALALGALALCAARAVAKQLHYDIVGKLKSSFQPSRHWGPRDPITHYYWLAKRYEGDRRNLPRTRYNRRELGQLSRRPSFLTISSPIHSKGNQTLPELKNRSKSDDWVYTIGRKQDLSNLYGCIDERKRSKSLDREVTMKIKSSDIFRQSKNNVSVVSECNEIVGHKYDNIHN